MQELDIGTAYIKGQSVYIAISRKRLVRYRNGRWVYARGPSGCEKLAHYPVNALEMSWGCNTDVIDSMFSLFFAPKDLPADSRPSYRSAQRHALTNDNGPPVFRSAPITKAL